jgi:guanylate kinase
MVTKSSQSPLVVILSGPSGVGKDAVINYMKETNSAYHFAVTATTRSRRSNEENGVDYEFLYVQEFLELRDNGGLLESAQIFGHWYGVPKAQVIEALDQGKDVVLKIDIQGAETIRHLLPDSLSIFLMPPSLEVLKQRLLERGTEESQDLEDRLAMANEEINAALLFDHVVINEDGLLDQTVLAIEHIIRKEKPGPDSNGDSL